MTMTKTTMLSSSFTTLLLFLSSATLSTGYPSSSDVKYLAKGQCSYAGQIVCASESTFAICDTSLTGVIQPLAVGDTRCGAFGDGGGGGKNTPPPPASSSTTAAAAAQDTLAFMKTVASMMATALHPSSKPTPTPTPTAETTPPPSKPSPKPSLSTTTKKPPKETTSKAQPAKSSSSSSSKSNPHFASGTGLQVIPITIRGATPTAGGS
ncbi:hypothetical protein AYO21_05664 [Fonsecaea monophora]|uniref:Carbohydrate-binding module family 19 domain-containing protein n=1 Tax=Fonsecaea monophora TaxID=254056 RepID=A0A177F8S8_9EURO|nr:hypothetical protein AYO21_05664 [Fonsecaea monophora]OAG40186.1 hypothetical protein AYO21_05664 [Fonsecaea monophora]